MFFPQVFRTSGSLLAPGFPGIFETKQMEKTMQTKQVGLLGYRINPQPLAQGLLSIPVSTKRNNRSSTPGLLNAHFDKEKRWIKK